MVAPTRTASDGLGAGGTALAALFLTSGVLHFMRPQHFEAIVPSYLPAPRQLVYASGVAEIACAVGLLVPATRHAAGFGSAALLAGVFPANVTMAGQAKRRFNRDPNDAHARGLLAVAVARLPMQWPMIRTALRVAGVRR